MWGVGCGVWSLGLGVWGLGFGVWGVGIGRSEEHTSEIQSQSGHLHVVAAQHVARPNVPPHRELHRLLGNRDPAFGVWGLVQVP